MREVYSFSEAGGQVANEDRFEVQQHPNHPTGWLCVLADGQGGRAGGARAAELACRVVAAAAVLLPAEQLADGLAWAELLGQADRVVAADSNAGFTTLAGFWLADGRIAGASVGDSAVYLVQPGGKRRELTAGQFKNPPVGSGEPLIVPFAAPVAAEAVILAMSDGVWKYAGQQRIMSLAAQEPCPRLLESLQQAARMPGNGRFQDDFTVVVFAAEQKTPQAEG